MTAGVLLILVYILGGALILYKVLREDKNE